MTSDDDERIRTHFRGQAETSRDLGSAFTGRVLALLADRLDDSHAFGRTVLGWPGRLRDDALSLRVAGGLHALVLSARDEGLAAVYPEARRDVSDDELWQAIAAAMARHQDFLLRFIESPPQTNEVARSGVLIGGFATVAARFGLPLRLLEIGASAGLNLHWDAYRYRLGDSRWGDGAAGVLLAPEWRGAAVTLPPIAVASRAGCDQSPIDPGDPEQSLHLRSYVWAGQPERMQRIAAALAHAAASPIRVERADAADWVERQLAAPVPGQASVLYHSIMWQYLPETVAGRIEAALADAGAKASAEAPIAWLRMERSNERSSAELLLTTWPDGGERRLAFADYHGRWVEWLDD